MSIQVDRISLPSILNLDRTGLNDEKHIPELDGEVFADLRLDRFFTVETLRIFGDPCSKADIEARLDMHQTYESTRISELYRFADEVCDSGKHLKKARCDAERNVVFLDYISRCCAFANNAAALGNNIGNGGFLAKRFAEYVGAAVSTEKYALMKKRAAECRKLFETIHTATLNISANVPLMYRSPMDSHITRLSGLAKELGCEGIKLPTHSGREISVGLIAGFEKLYPDEFARFAEFYADYNDYFDESIAAFRSELKFYREIFDWKRRLAESGVKLIRPGVSDVPQIMAKGCRDVTLLLKNTLDIVPNDLEFTSGERLFFLTGANGGGKTSFLRSLGVCLILFLGGCPVPCDSADIYPFKRVFTHFPHDERFNGTGRLLDEKKRVDEIIARCDGDSVVLFNETFSGTDEEKSTALTAQTAKQLSSLGAFGVYVTHIHSLGEDVLPELNVMVDESDQNRRTYKVVRHGHVKSSFARDILLKYSLTNEQLEARDARISNETAGISGAVDEVRK